MFRKYWLHFTVGGWIALALLLTVASGCAATLTTGQVKLDLELKEYARKPALDYVSSLLQKDEPKETDDAEPEESEPEP